MKTFCYHTRNAAGIKLTGGMLHADSLQDAAERAARVSKLKAALTFTGREVFIRENGDEVFLYLSVHPEYTERGKAELKQAHETRNAERLRRAEEESDED